MTSTQWKGKFLNVNIPKIKNTLKKIGGKLVHKRALHKYVIFLFPEFHDKRQVRIKKSPDRITLSLYKDLMETGEYKEDVHVRVSSYERMIEFLQKMGMVNKRNREYYRETYVWKKVKIEFYTYPGLETFIRISGADTKIVKELFKKLNLKMNDAVYYETEKMYAKMFDTTPDKILDVKNISFDNIDNVSVYFIREAKREYYQRQEKETKRQHRRRRNIEGKLISRIVKDD